MSRLEAIRAHFAEHADVVERTGEELGAVVARYIELALDTVRAGGTIFFCGNGGSAADAQHLAAEFVVRFARTRPAAPAVALTTDTSILTATGNDLGFEQVFSRQVEALGRPGDLLVLHSTSGRSANLTAAAVAAREAGVTTIALLARDGGPLAGLVDLPLIVPTESTARAQEIHLLIGHVVCDAIDAELASSP